MSERIGCESCAQPMAAIAARCPHCGALQKRAKAAAPAAPRPTADKARPVLRDLSGDEARALLAVSAARENRGEKEEGESFDVMSWMFVPDPRSRGAAHIAEIVLTVVALPALLSAFVGAMLAYRTLSRARRSRDAKALRGALMFLGFVGLVTIVSFSGASYTTMAVLCAIPMLALMLREAVRNHSRKRHAMPDLMR